MAKKSNSLNYTKEEFVETFQFGSTKILDDRLNLWREIYGMNVNPFKKSKEPGALLEIQFEMAPVIALILHTFQKHPLYRKGSDISKVSLEGLIQYNNFVFEKMEWICNLSATRQYDYMKYLIMGQQDFVSPYKLSSFLPLLSQYVSMLFATITRFHSELAEEPVSQLIDQLTLWTHQYFYHHLDMEEKIKPFRKDSDNNAASIKKGLKKTRSIRISPPHTISPIIHMNAELTAIRGVDRLYFSTYDHAILSVCNMLQADDISNLEDSSLNNRMKEDSQGNGENAEVLRILRLKELNDRYASPSDVSHCDFVIASINRQKNILALYYETPADELFGEVANSWDAKTRQKRVSAVRMQKEMFKQLEKNRYPPIKKIFDQAIGQMYVEIMAQEQEQLRQQVKDGNR